jgi:hypothetical protein
MPDTNTHVLYLHNNSYLYTCSKTYKMLSSIYLVNLIFQNVLATVCLIKEPSSLSSSFGENFKLMPSTDVVVRGEAFPNKLT